MYIYKYIWYTTICLNHVCMYVWLKIFQHEFFKYAYSCTCLPTGYASVEWKTSAHIFVVVIVAVAV